MIAYVVLLLFGLAIGATQLITGFCLSSDSLLCSARFLRIKDVKRRTRFLMIKKGNCMIVGTTALALTAVFAFGLMPVNLFVGIMVSILIVDKLFDSIFEYHQLSV